MAQQIPDASLSHLALHARHVDLGARMVPFAGFHMPLQYDSITVEHEAVRSNVGFFDVSHMGEIEVRGADAIDVIDRLVPNDCQRLSDGQALYTVMCHEHGGIVDDLLVYRLASDHVLLCVNAANRAKDFAHINTWAKGDSDITETSDEWSQFAIQGPRAIELVSTLVGGEITSLGSFWCRWAEIAGARVLVSRTGYTGEDGVEIYVPIDASDAVFTQVERAGRSFGLQMCGLGARDTLRLEARLHLYGQDLDDETNPIEAGLSWTVKLDTPTDFVGKNALQEIKARGPSRRLRGLEVTEDRGVIRHGYEVFDGEQPIGRVTSGGHSPTLGYSIGLAYLDVDAASLDHVDVAVRRKTLRAKVTKGAFYKRPEP